jgi:hypothetical protein
MDVTPCALATSVAQTPVSEVCSADHLSDAEDVASISTGGSTQRCPRVSRTLPPVANTGLLPGELVVRGGRLRSPMILGNLRDATGRRFLDLHKDDDFLCEFLSGKQRFKRPFTGWPLFDQLRDLRNSYCKKALADLLSMEPLEGTHSEEKPTDLKAPKSVRRASFWDLAKLPLVMTFSFTDDALPEPWEFAALVEIGMKAISIEATTPNFNTMTRLFHAWSLDQERQSSGTRQLRRAKSDSKKPRGSPHSRVYHIASKGFVKLQVEDAPSRSFARDVNEVRAVPSSKRVARKGRRFLKRLPSGEVRPTAAEVLGGSTTGSADDDDALAFRDEF